MTKPEIPVSGLSSIQDAPALARGLAHYLRHLRDYHGLTYVSGAALPPPKLDASPSSQVSAADDGKNHPPTGAQPTAKSDGGRKHDVSTSNSGSEGGAAPAPGRDGTPHAAKPTVTDRGGRTARPSAVREPAATAAGNPVQSQERATRVQVQASQNQPGAQGPQGPQIQSQQAGGQGAQASQPQGAQASHVQAPERASGQRQTLAQASRAKGLRVQASPPPSSTGPAPQSRQGHSVAPKRAAARPSQRGPTRVETPQARGKKHAPTSRLPIVSDPRGGAPAPTKPKGDPRSWPPARKIEYLRYHMGDCQRCQLARTRTTIVFGSGNPEAQIMFVGEAPGADEDRQGRPFVGRAGKRLTQMLRELSIERSEIYIANVLKCRPPRNRDPKPEEVHACSKFLEAQIRAIAPRVIVALGRHAGMLMLRRNELTLREMRGRQWTYEQPAANLKIPIYITYHPSFVLRQESDARRNSDNPSEAHATVVGDLREAFSVIRAVGPRDR